MSTEIEILNLIFLGFEAYQKEDNEEEAKGYFTQVLEKDNDHLIALAYRGNCNRLLDCYGESLKDFSRALEIMGEAPANALKEFVEVRLNDVKGTAERTKFGIKAYLDKANTAYENKKYSEALGIYLHLFSFPYAPYPLSKNLAESPSDISMKTLLDECSDSFNAFSYETKLQICVRFLECKLHDSELTDVMLNDLLEFNDKINKHIIAPVASTYVHSEINGQECQSIYDKNALLESLYEKHRATEPTASTDDARECCESEIKRRLKGNYRSTPQFFIKIEQINRRQETSVLDQKLESLKFV